MHGNAWHTKFTHSYNPTSERQVQCKTLTYITHP
jgi:hypothetical protein